MCGINGIVTTGVVSSVASIERMNDALAHRGPDDQGVVEGAHYAFGHQRLSILDLSKAGHQPMTNNDGNLIIVFNGEIYNYRELKSECKDYAFKTRCDTEVILAAYEKWGSSCLEHFNGMFSFAIYNIRSKHLFLARDRLGIKPLYYAIEEGRLVFSSEIRAILRSGLVKKKLNEKVLHEYLSYQTVHAPNTLIKNVSMLQPGQYMEVILENRLVVNYKCWWKLHVSPSDPSVDEAKARVKKLIYAAVERRMISDVPVGAFLSGGIDSSAVVAVMSELSEQPIDTFNVSFKEQQFDESEYARLVASRYSTNHHDVNLEASSLLDNLPDALSHVDHPSGDGINTWIVSKAVKDHGIRVALSGLGGDELFVGYPLFKSIRLLSRLKMFWELPQNIRKIVASGVGGVSSSVASMKLQSILSNQEFSHIKFHGEFRKVLLDTQIDGLLNAQPGEAEFTDIGDIDKGYNYSATSVAEISGYMQNVLLRDTDQMSMAHSLEVRVPFLDHTLVEYCLSLPDKIKHPDTPKSLMVNSLGGLVPDSVVNRKKMGFVLPWEQWLKNELAEYAESRLVSLGSRSYFNYPAISELWSRFKNNDSGVSFSRIWLLVSLSEWLEQNDIS